MAGAERGECVSLGVKERPWNLAGEKGHGL